MCSRILAGRPKPSRDRVDRQQEMRQKRLCGGVVVTLLKAPPGAEKINLLPVQPSQSPGP
jgi:hypothetical protein